MDGDWAGRMAVRPEARDPPRLGFVRVDRKRVVVATARMHNVVRTAAERALRPRVDEIEGERRLHADRRVQRGRRTPRAKPQAGDELARNAGGRERQRATVAGDLMATARHAGHLHLQTLD